MSRFKKSLYDWCIENDREDILQFWDYKLNNINPENIGYSNKGKYWFKCPRGIHKSELKHLHNLVTRHTYLKCNQCASFGQWLIDTYGNNALGLYWDDKKNEINPFEISRGSEVKIWVKCQEKDYHGSYEVRCDKFLKKIVKCPYCCNYRGKVHPRDSFAQYHIDNTDPNFLEGYWSKKNTIDPFSVTIGSEKKIWIICQKDEEHKDYEIRCYDFTYGKRCPTCKESKGERRIRKWLNIHKIDFVCQKKFYDLFGINGGNLSYDFYLPKQNILIEYQGNYHDGTVYRKTRESLEYQQEHDKRKREYAESHGVKLLEIWYWDYDNIEEILNKNIK